MIEESVRLGPAAEAPLHVVATAGHVDHGKSSLILRLTGIDPDRWAEEKRRGLTIDLGFAWCTLPSGREIGFVDVPGHERFVRNMLAGVGPVQLVLFVVAADEGWKPQSEEHLAIVDVLGADGGVFALTKRDPEDGWSSARRSNCSRLGVRAGSAACRPTSARSRRPDPSRVWRPTWWGWTGRGLAVGTSWASRGNGGRPGRSRSASGRYAGLPIRSPPGGPTRCMRARPNEGRGSGCTEPAGSRTRRDASPASGSPIHWSWTSTTGSWSEMRAGGRRWPAASSST